MPFVMNSRFTDYIIRLEVKVFGPVVSSHDVGYRLRKAIKILVG